jgi:hypothetical protein
MSLADLRNVLQGQADGQHAISVSAATIVQAGLVARDGLDALLRGHLALGSQDLALSYSGPVPEPTGDSLTLTGSAPLLGVPSATAIVTFMAPAGGAADVRVAVRLPGGWTLATAFPSLTKPPFDEMTLTDAQWLVTTLPQDSYTWNGAVQPLVQGSTLLSLVGLDGPLAVATLLTTGSTKTVPLTGIVDPSHPESNGGTPAMALSAPLGGTVAVSEFALSAPKIEIQTAPAPEFGLLAWLAFATTLSVDGSPLCDFKALIRTSRSEVTFVLSPVEQLAPVSLSPDQMASLIHVDYHGLIPDSLASLFDAVTLKGLAATISVGQSTKLLSVSASIGAIRPWQYGQFTLEELTFTVIAMAPLGTAGVLTSLEARAKLFPDVIDGEFEVEATYESESGDLTVGASFTGDIELSKVVRGLSGGTVSLPDELELTFSDFGATLYKPSGGSSSYVFYGAIEAGITLPFLGVRIDGGLQVLVDSAAHSYQLTGCLLMGWSAFTVTVDLTAADKVVTGQWAAATEPDYLGIDSLASAAGLTAPPIPPALDLNLKSATLSYHVTAKTLVLEAESASYGKAAFIAGANAAGQWGYVFGVLPSVSVTLDLSTIDVIGKLVPSGDDILSLTGLRIVAATSVLPALTPPPDVEDIVGSVLTSGLQLFAELKVGTASEDKLSVSFGEAGQPSLPGTAAASGNPVLVKGDVPRSTPVRPAPQATWIEVQRSFGPVQFERVGFTVTSDAELSVLLDASVSIAGLTIGLTGLQASMPIRAPYVPSFDLAGLQVQFSGGAVNITGGLAKVPGKTPAEYTGDLQVQLAQFGLTMLGSYTTISGQPSLFAFGVLEAPLGGPAFFFVTGLAGGFGYNRSLALPVISGVGSYPLIQGAMGKLNPDTTAAELAKYISPAQNEYWLAAGVRFTSFELVQSFALLTVSFGTSTEIALLGESTIVVPVPAEGETARPVARADLVLMVDISPSNGLLAVSAQLSPQSYVLDASAQLTGGFAFYAWFAPSAHAGDFVITLGGYNPYYTPPSHYPQTVPRLGLNWQLSSELSISGGLYFALTPSVLMAGGYLKATWNSGDLSAWFDAQADFLMRFRPFQYLATIGVSIGVSLTVDLLVTTLRITIHAGVSLTLWGPPFGGTARIDLSIISFTLGFGAPQPDPPAEISWPQFRQSFLPAAGKSERDGIAAPTSPPVTTTDSLIKISAAQGLLRTVKAGDADGWIVSSSSLRIVVTTQVPSTSADVVASTTITPSGTWSRQLGVGPMGAGAGTLDSALTITINRGNAPDPEVWAATATTGAVPKALYLNTSTQMQTDGTVGDALVGVELTPAPPTGGSTLPVPVAQLAIDDPPVRDFSWSAVVPPDSDSFDQRTAMAQLQSSLTDPGVVRVRDGVLAALRRQGLPVAGEAEVAGFAAAAPGLMASPPQLRLLGEEVHP